MKLSCSPVTALPLVALVMPLLMVLPAHAQVPFLPVKVSMAPDSLVTQLGIVQGNVVVPFSNIETPDQVGVSLHTNLLILRPSAAGSAVAFPPLLQTALASSFASPLSLLSSSMLWGGFTPQPTLTGSGPSGSFLPADLKKAYGLPSTGGSGTIVLIGSYHYPTALSDFNSFSSYTGLPTETSTNPLLNTNKVFQVVYATGRQPNTQPSGNYSLEAALDIEWAHAMAPNAKIVLVEATTNTTIDLFYGAVEKGNNLPGVQQISMSYGGSEFSSQTYFDAIFTHTGIVYFASSGDTGGVILWPSSSANVVGVGGTSLTTNSSTQSYVSETGWSGSGGGVSAYETKPTYQSGVTLNGSTFSNRATPDVSLVADPNTGVLVFYQGNGYIVGGTSLAAPATAGIVNLSGSHRTSTSAQLTQTYSIYKNASSYSTNFRDIKSGTAGSNSCLTGFDLVTGIGTPLGTGGF
jgi:subtilase family serine protease